MQPYISAEVEAEVLGVVLVSPGSFGGTENYYTAILLENDFYFLNATQTETLNPAKWDHAINTAYESAMLCYFMYIYIYLFIS